MSPATLAAALVGGVVLAVLVAASSAVFSPAAEVHARPDEPLAERAAAGLGLESLWQRKLLPARAVGPRHADPVADQTAVLPPTHTVEPGDTLGRVAERYRVTSRSMARANAVDLQGTLRPGQELIIPSEDPVNLASPEDAMAAGLAVQRLLTDAAAEFGLDPALVQAVAWVESRWEQRVVSGRGAVGLLQVRPPTGRAMGRLLGREIDLHRAEDNVVGGAAYLAQRLDEHHGDLPAALADYHQGPHSVAQQGWIPATVRYIDDVLSLRDRFAAQTAHS